MGAGSVVETIEQEGSHKAIPWDRQNDAIPLRTLCDGSPGKRGSNLAAMQESENTRYA